MASAGSELRKREIVSQMQDEQAKKKASLDELEKAKKDLAANDGKLNIITVVVCLGKSLGLAIVWIVIYDIIAMFGFFKSEMVSSIILLALFVVSMYYQITVIKNAPKKYQAIYNYHENAYNESTQTIQGLEKELASIA